MFIYNSVKMTFVCGELSPQDLIRACNLHLWYH